MSQNFRLFHVSNLSVRNFRIFLLMYTVSLGLVGRVCCGCRDDTPWAGLCSRPGTPRSPWQTPPTEAALPPLAGRLVRTTGFVSPRGSPAGCYAYRDWWPLHSSRLPTATAITPAGGRAARGSCGCLRPATTYSALHLRARHNIPRRLMRARGTTKQAGVVRKYNVLYVHQYTPARDK